MAIAEKQGDLELLTVQEVARLLRLSVGAVRNLIQKREIPALRLGKQYRIPKYVIENLMAPLLGESRQAVGFGAWKRKGKAAGAVDTVNKIRDREDRKSLEQILEEMREWEKASSLTRTS